MKLAVGSVTEMQEERTVPSEYSFWLTGHGWDSRHLESHSFQPYISAILAGNLAPIRDHIDS